MANEKLPAVEVPAKKDYALTALQRMWVQQSLSTQRNVLVRSRNKEMSGSDIYHLRTKEIEALGELLNIFSS